MIPVLRLTVFEGKGTLEVIQHCIFRAKSSPGPIVVNKVLLKHCHSRSFAYYLWMLDMLAAGVIAVRLCMAHKVYSIYYLVLDIKGLLTPDLITPFRSDVKTDSETEYRGGREICPPWALRCDGGRASSRNHVSCALSWCSLPCMPPPCLSERHFFCKENRTPDHSLWEACLLSC